VRPHQLALDNCDLSQAAIAESRIDFASFRDCEIALENIRFRADIVVFGTGKGVYCRVVLGGTPLADADCGPTGMRTLPGSWSGGFCSLPPLLPEEYRQ